jgi:hypothetical protein
MTIETTAHSMENLFAQLGLPCEITKIQRRMVD